MTAITITNAGHGLLRDGISGASLSLVTYVAMGSGTTAPAVTDTQLSNETFRKRVSSFVNGGAIGEVLISAYISPSDAIGADVEEIAFYGGNATALANSGTMLARGLYTHNPKIGTESIVFVLDITT